MWEEQKKELALLIGKYSRLQKSIKCLRIHQKQSSKKIHPILPKSIEIKVLNEYWKVMYLKNSFPGVEICSSNDSTVMVCGNVGKVKKCREAIRAWLMEKAKDQITPLLHNLSIELNLPFGKVLVKGQKTIWGSCSRHKTLSINFKLLLIRKELVRYVFIHELCHTVYLDHSSKFWSLVEQKEPNYKELDKELRSAWRSLPPWVHI